MEGGVCNCSWTYSASHGPFRGKALGPRATPAQQAHAKVARAGKTRSAAQRREAGTCRLQIAAARPLRTRVRHQQLACVLPLAKCHLLRRRHRYAANTAQYSVLRRSTCSAERTDQYRSSPRGRQSRLPPQAFQRLSARPRLEKGRRDEGSRHKGFETVAKEPGKQFRVSTGAMVLGVRVVLGGNKNLYPKPV